MFCLDCALAAAGVRTSGRSGRSAVQYRRRMNGIYAELVPAPEEIDLRDRVAPVQAPEPTPEPTPAPAPPAPSPAPAATTPVETLPAEVRRRLARRPDPAPVAEEPDLEAEETAAWLAAATEIQVTQTPSPRRSSAPPLSR